MVKIGRRKEEMRGEIMNIRGSPEAHLRFISFVLKENIMEE